MIQQAIVSRNTSKQELHALVDAVHSFYLSRQRPNMTHSEYLDKFKDLVEVVVQCGRDIGGDRIHVRNFIINKWGADPDYLNDEDYNKAVGICPERYLAMCLLSKVDKHGVGNLLIDITNEYTRNPTVSSYPKTVAKAYKMIINYRSRGHCQLLNLQEGGLTFLSDGAARDNNGRAGRGNGTGRGRGGRATNFRGRGGHGRGDRSAEHYDEQHEAQFLLDSVNDLESDVDAYTNLSSRNNGGENTEIVLQLSNNPLPKG